VVDPIGSGSDGGCSDGGGVYNLMRTVNNRFTEKYLTLTLGPRYHIKIKRNRYRINFLVSKYTHKVIYL